MLAVKIDGYSQSVNSFNKFEWESRWLSSVQAGDVSWQTGTIAPVLRTSLGTAEEHCHVPLVWRRDATLASLAGMSPKTYRKRRDELERTGFLFEIATGHGSRQTIKVLKMPAWSQSEALHVARDALAAYCERTGNQRLRWVEDALCYAIRCQDAATSATYQGERIHPEHNESEQTGSPPGANGKSSLLPPYIHENDSVLTGSSSEHVSPQDSEQEQLPPAIKENSKKIIDLDTLKALRRTIISLFAEVGRKLDEGGGTVLAKRYGARGATSEELRDTLELQLLRLTADGYSTGQISEFLAKDAIAWTKPTPRTAQNSYRIPPSCHRKSEQKPDPYADFWDRHAELDAQFHGNLDLIHARLVDEFGQNHPCLN